MQPVTGPGTPPRGQTPPPPGPDQPLTTAQRMTLERLITRIMALSPSKPAEIWAALFHHLQIAGGGELRVRHFLPTEQLLQGRLVTAQETLAGRQLLQQLTDLLPQGNNRQAVSDFIRSQFGHTVLSQLDAGQLRQVLHLLQNGQLDIPAPQQAAMTDRTLLPAEHQALSQLITRLAALTGETPTELWESLHRMMGLKSGDPIPARHFPLLSQFLQSHLTLSQQGHPTLATLTAVLKHPVHGEEQQAVEQYCRQHFAADSQTPDVRLLQPLTHTLIAIEHDPRPVRSARSPLVIGVFVAVVLVVIWLLAR